MEGAVSDTPVPRRKNPVHFSLRTLLQDSQLERFYGLDRYEILQVESSVQKIDKRVRKHLQKSKVQACGHKYFEGEVNYNYKVHCCRKEPITELEILLRVPLMAGES